MPFGLALNQLLLFAILIAAIVLLLTEWIRIDLVAVLIILALSLSGLLTPDEALSGFSSEPAIMLASIFVISGALNQTGLSEQFGNGIRRLAGRTYQQAIAVIMPAVALLSAFIGHVALTAIMLPVMLKISQENDIPPSKLLMPMAFAASLGTTVAIIGAPAFLIANGLLIQAGQGGLGIFSIAPIGLALTTAGTLFVLLTGGFLLPAHERGDEDFDHFRLEGYYTELVLLEKSDWIGKTIQQIEEKQDPGFKVTAWLREDQRRSRPFGRKKTKAGDVLVVRTNPEKLASIQQEPGLALQPLYKYEEDVSTSQENGSDKEEDISSQFVQSVVAPRSYFIGKTIGQVDFRRNYGVIIVSVWRQSGWLRTELSRVRLQEGDVLVMMGDSTSLRRIAEDRSFLMMVPFKGEPKPLHKAPLAAGILALAILLSSLNLVPVDIALLGGAAAMVLTRCLSMRQAYQSIDTRIYVFIAGAIPLGLAMEKTGAAALLGEWLQGGVATWPVPLILFTLFLVAGLLTQIMSDSATTALLAPVALALALGLGLAPQPFVITVAMASVASFFTPIGHHGNLLIYGPGRYQFSDFLRAGIPLTILVAIIVSLLAPVLWPAP